MNDLKHTKGKNQLDSLQPGFLWDMGLALTHGNMKYGKYNWQHGERHDYVAALLRHTLQYLAGEVYDTETGLPHTAFIACNTMFLHWHDHGDTLPTHACYCPVCQPTNGHCTATMPGS